MKITHVILAVLLTWCGLLTWTAVQLLHDVEYLEFQTAKQHVLTQKLQRGVVIQATRTDSLKAKLDRHEKALRLIIDAIEASQPDPRPSTESKGE